MFRGLVILIFAFQNPIMKFQKYFLASLAAIGFSLGHVSIAQADSVSELGSLFGDYLAASYADEIDDMEARQSYFAKAFEAAPKDIRLGRRAIVAAIENGDMNAAIKHAESVYKLNKNEAMARGVLGVNAYLKGRESRALKYFEGSSDDVTMVILMRLVKGWIEVDRGDFDAARDIFDGLEGAAYFTGFGKLQSAKVDIFDGKYDDAETKLDEVDASRASGVDAVLMRTHLLVEQGKSDDALAKLNEVLEDNERLSISPVADYKTRLEEGRDLPKISIREHAARALTEPSFGFFLQNRSRDGAVLYLRFARWVDPNYQKSALWLGTMLEDRGEQGEKVAFELYDAIAVDDPYYQRAQLALAQIYFNQEKDDKAIEVLEALNARVNSLLTRESLGRARFFRENYAEALPFYNNIVDVMTDEEIKANVEPLRFRGIIFERLKRWPEAEADFKRVLEFAPDDVDTLNYLGYTWVDRGENLEEAFDMIERALEQSPNSGAITDSLGWAHYKLGNYVEAKNYLEDAVALSPSSATIIDHLGDVYWQLGRKREAGFQWQRALLFEPTDEEKSNIDVKLNGGLEALAPASPSPLP